MLRQGHLLAVIVSSHISGTQDLVTRFGLGSAYDQYVRPYTIKVSSGTAEGELDAKGKGKGVDGAEEPGEGAAAAAVAQGAMTKEKAKMMKKHYTHMIADVPGERAKALSGRVLHPRTALNDKSFARLASQGKTSWQKTIICEIFFEIQNLQTAVSLFRSMRKLCETPSLWSWEPYRTYVVILGLSVRFPLC